MEKTTTQRSGNAAIKFGKFVFFPGRRRLYFGQQYIGLTKKESGLLALFCDFANRLLPRSHALLSLWKYDTRFNGRSMDVYVSRLRKYIRHDPDILIMNVHGKGFKMLVPDIEMVPDDKGI